MPASRHRFDPPDPEVLQPHFPQLEILACIGQGGMGAVYRARQPALDRVVALKILPPEAAGDPGFTERFSREARALAQLSHPNIVAVHDFGEAGGFPYFIMEYVDGVTLRQLIRSGSITPREALAIVPQICDALQYAHDRGVVHRDIKPENILLDRKGVVKIADFGLAKLVRPDSPAGTMTGAGEIMGTPHYMAPEQLERPAEVDHRADIFSLGVVFYQMLTGELPIGRFAAPSRKVQIDVRLDEIVLRTLEKDPDLRFQRADTVKTEVESVAETSAPGERPGIRGVAGILRLWPIIALTLSGLIFALIGFDYLRRRESSPSTASLTNAAQAPATVALAPASTPASTLPASSDSTPASPSPSPALPPAATSIAAPERPESEPSSGAKTASSADSGLTPFDFSLTGWDEMEKNPEILGFELRAAESRFEDASQRYNLGAISADFFKRFQDDVKLLQARIGGDRVAFAQIQVEAAERELDAMKTRLTVGVATEQQVQDAETRLQIARTRQSEANASNPETP